MFTREQVETAVQKMKAEGCQVIVASEAFSVDNVENEQTVTAVAAENGLPATASHEISQLYGLKVRTRTAVVNASILPKMTATAELTDESIKKSGIKAPLMIMRSDGGVMDLVQMKQRPILTMLSGPGLALCALSYVTAYGFLVCSFLFFCLSILLCQDKKWEFKTLFQKGGIVLLVFVLLAGWWFIRNAVLYQGDFLGIRRRKSLSRAGSS